MPLSEENKYHVKLIGMFVSFPKKLPTLTLINKHAEFSEERVRLCTTALLTSDL